MHCCKANYQRLCTAYVCVPARSCCIHDCAHTFMMTHVCWYAQTCASHMFSIRARAEFHAWVYVWSVFLACGCCNAANKTGFSQVLDDNVFDQAMRARQDRHSLAPDLMSTANLPGPKHFPTPHVECPPATKQAEHSQADPKARKKRKTVSFADSVDVVGDGTLPSTSGRWVFAALIIFDCRSLTMLASTCLQLCPVSFFGRYRMHAQKYSPTWQNVQKNWFLFSSWDRGAVPACPAHLQSTDQDKADHLFSSLPLSV